MAALRIRRISRHLSGRSRRFQMPESLYEKERRIGIKAVLKASRICISVFDRIASQGITVIKEDRSPVTIADYAAQAVINTVLHESFPSDIIVGEEDADELSQQPALLASVLSLVRSELGPDFSSEQVIKAINLGNGSGGKGRFWTLDPIDGTKGFLRGDQFAVCLALIVDGQVEVSIMGCPNLPMDLQDSNSPRGSLFVGVRGQGAFQVC